MSAETTKDAAVEQAMCGEAIQWESVDRVYFLKIKSLVDEKISIIRREVTEARRIRATGGPYAGREWMRSSEEALASGGLLSQKIQLRITETKGEHGRRQQAAWQAERPTFERAFMQVAKEMLTGAQFAAITAEANLRIKGV